MQSSDRHSLDDQEFQRTHGTGGQRPKHEYRENKKQNSFLAPVVQSLSGHAASRLLDWSTAWHHDSGWTFIEQTLLRTGRQIPGSSNSLNPAAEPKVSQEDS